MKKKPCVNCGEKVSIRQGKVGTYLVKREEAESEKLKIVDTEFTWGNPHVLVEGFFCLDCHEEVCGDSEKS